MFSLERESEHILRNSAILLFWGWLAYTCFKRAIKPPTNHVSRWGYSEVEAFNRNPLVRALSVLCGLLVLLIGFAIALAK